MLKHYCTSQLILSIFIASAWSELFSSTWFIFKGCVDTAVITSKGVELETKFTKTECMASCGPGCVAIVTSMDDSASGVTCGYIYDSTLFNGVPVLVCNPVLGSDIVALYIDRDQENTNQCNCSITLEAFGYNFCVVGQSVYVDYAGAISHCQSLGMELPVADSVDDFASVALAATNAGGSGYIYYGADDLDNDGVIQWNNGRGDLDAGSGLWAIGQPDLAGEQCVVNFNGGYLHDVMCSHSLFLVCVRQC